MKIAILHGPRDLRIEDQVLDTSQLQPDEIWVKTRISAFKIGTDRGNYEGAEQVPGAPGYPRWVSVAWPMFAPQEHVSCWLALDDATVENGCMTVIPGSHQWGPIARQYQGTFLSNPLLAKPVPVEIKAGHCMFHHGLNFHRTGANNTPNRRRGLALHYIRAETMYLGSYGEKIRSRRWQRQPNARLLRWLPHKPKP